MEKVWGGEKKNHVRNVVGISGRERRGGGGERAAGTRGFRVVSTTGKKPNLRREEDLKH